MEHSGRRGLVTDNGVETDLPEALARSDLYLLPTYCMSAASARTALGSSPSRSKAGAMSGSTRPPPLWARWDETRVRRGHCYLARTCWAGRLSFEPTEQLSRRFAVSAARWVSYDGMHLGGSLVSLVIVLCAMPPQRSLVFRGGTSELGQIGRLLGKARAGESAAMVVRGEAGIGKTALLDQCAEQASDFQVVRIAGVESEMELPFAGLHQLCAPILAKVDTLPDPQQNALRVSFGLVSATLLTVSWWPSRRSACWVKWR
jgi:hypothetical protein